MKKKIGKAVGISIISSKGRWLWFWKVSQQRGEMDLELKGSVRKNEKRIEKNFEIHLVFNLEKTYNSIASAV